MTTPILFLYGRDLGTVGVILISILLCFWGYGMRDEIYESIHNLIKAEKEGRANRGVPSGDYGAMREEDMIRCVHLDYPSFAEDNIEPNPQVNTDDDNPIKPEPVIPLEDINNDNYYR